VVKEMSTHRQVIVRAVAETWSFNTALRRAHRAARELAWALRFNTPSDEENLAFKWAVVHVRAGRPDLAREDLRWLHSRLENQR
jgi:hypothetical protein